MPMFQMRQKVWLLKDDFVVRDADNNEAYRVTSRLFSWGHQLVLADPGGTELAHIKQRVMSWGPTYEIERDGAIVATVKTKLMSFRERLDIAVADGDTLEVVGSFSDHDYTLSRGDVSIATVSMRWFSISDTYGIEVADGEDQVLAIAIAVVIDMVFHADQD